MSKTGTNFPDHIEWEALDSEEAISNLTMEKGVLKLRSDCAIKFSRTHDYKLSMIISGIVNGENDIEQQRGWVPGTFMENENIIGAGMFGGAIYKFHSVHIESVTTSYLGANIRSFTALAGVGGVERSEAGNNRKTAILHDWFLSGKSNIYFPQRTNRAAHVVYTKSRPMGTDEYKPHPDTSMHVDYMEIKHPEFTFIVARVPEKIGPKWSFNLVIEYREAFGRIPDEDEREAISELVGFVLGNQLLKIGCTSYDETYNFIKREYENPWGDNILNKCSEGAMPPVEIENHRNSERIEPLLAELIPNYLKLRTSLNLSDILWKYWLSKDSTLGTNLPMLSSAIESLAEQMLKDDPRGKPYIPYHEFNTLIAEEVALIEKKILNNPHKDIIIKKIKDSANRSANKNIQSFFELIQLPVGKVEKDAMSARHKMAHSANGVVDDTGAKALIKQTRAYQSLFHRVILKILSYNGPYIDYYTEGFPKRNINEFIP